VEGRHAHLRIGELSRRVGVSSDRLRAWERRYGVLRPERTAGGFRLYSDDDERRVKRMRELLAEGLAPAEAARLAMGGHGRKGSPAGRGIAELASQLAASLYSFDGAGAHSAFDRLLVGFGMEVTLRDVVYPYLHELGGCWERGEATVCQEHFASRLLQGRLLALAHGWDEGEGPSAVLACAPGELHDLGLIGFGLAMRNRGWRISYLGADTPIGALRDAASQLSPALVTMSAVDPLRFRGLIDHLRRLPGHAPLLLGGTGATAAVAKRLGASATDRDPVSAAEEAAGAAVHG
jgi:DNA-binding transcriptional MerR regulator